MKHKVTFSQIRLNGFGVGLQNRWKCVLTSSIAASKKCTDPVSIQGASVVQGNCTAKRACGNLCSGSMGVQRLLGMFATFFVESCV
jgi:hypothetical protein